MKLSVIIVSYNVKYYVEQCLWSLERALDGIDAEVFVVDNHSHDDTVEYLHELFPDVHVVESNHNLGFARANNVAVRQSQGEYVLFLNPDTIVAENSIRQCVSFLDEHQDAGGVGLKMLKCDGEPAMESRRGLPTPTTAFYKMCGLCARFPRHRRFGHYYMGYLSWDEAAQIEVISGAFCMARRKALDQVGLFDEDFFMYGEDIDLSYRLLKGGFTNWYLPETILHYKGESTQKTSFRYVHVFYEAMLIFFRKHYGHYGFWFTIPIKIAIYVRAFTALLGMLPKALRRFLGFRVRMEDAPHYIYIGGEQARKQCEKLMLSKGISITAYEGDEQSRPQGHLDLMSSLPKDSLVYVVFDTQAYSYGAIFRIMQQQKVRNVYMATYYPEQNILITDKDIFV